MRLMEADRAWLCVWQKFIWDLVNQLGRCGLSVPAPDAQPPIVYHNGCSHFPVESMQEAVEAARDFFRGTEPGIIFCLLPDAGRLLPCNLHRRCSTSNLSPQDSKCSCAHRCGDMQLL